ncbi:MAG: hypothetical protein NUK65_03615 [Firmicutes bacterium]|nr:hypothetical protein [Bacillota bacterium]
MKIIQRALMLFLLLVMISAQSLQALSPAAELPAKDTSISYLEQKSENNTIGLHESEALRLVANAHASAVELFTAAFEAELTKHPKTSWSAVRTELLQSWSTRQVDGMLRTFYDEYLWEWGYEMGFAFPLWQTEEVQIVKMISLKQDEVILECRVYTDYETIENIQYHLIRENKHWVLDSVIGETMNFI